ncbi:hypothetical protein [Actinoplanes rectilineatus]|uniref:hypothetical protein n=1 Tax=Actinoplanes rectilineatus TaxID=113571 RepID=UPI00146FF4B4|nr:hypothetical protein [Actinoplanes rectilineatus]
MELSTVEELAANRPSVPLRRDAAKTVRPEVERRLRRIAPGPDPTRERRSIDVSRFQSAI